jgi:tRNA uridine 5-carbamoylmethylation protein Kti12
MVKEAKAIYQSDDEKLDIKFWKQVSSEEKLSTVQYLREQYINLFNKQDEYAESRKRLRRFYRIIK